MTPREIAEKACVSQSTVYALLKAGRLPGFRVGCRGRGKWLVRWEDWEAFLASCKVAAGSVDDGRPFRFLN